jgi:hypothetical protein
METIKTKTMFASIEKIKKDPMIFTKSVKAADKQDTALLDINRH